MPGARFPFVKGLDGFEFGYQPSLDKKEIQTPGARHFVEHGENVIILGPPGVGKTQLAVGLGLKAIEQGYRPGDGLTLGAVTIALAAAALAAQAVPVRRATRIDPATALRME